MSEIDKILALVANAQLVLDYADQNYHPHDDLDMFERLRSMRSALKEIKHDITLDDMLSMQETIKWQAESKRIAVEQLVAKDKRIAELEQQLFLCNECIDQLSRQIAEALQPTTGGDET